MRFMAVSTTYYLLLTTDYAELGSRCGVEAERERRREGDCERKREGEKERARERESERGREGWW